MSKTAVISALVLKVTDHGENDRLVSLLSAERGRITVVAKGGRSVRYKYLPSIQLFTYSAFELYEKNGMYWIKDAVVSTYFPHLCDSIEGVALASYLSELAYELSGENESGDSILRLLLNCFYTISESSKPYGMIKAVFELRSVCYSGYMPELSACDECGKESGELFYIDIMNGRLLCPDCFGRSPSDKPEGDGVSDSINALGERNTYIPASLGVINTVRYILSAEQKRVFAFKLDSEKDRYDLYRLAEVYATWHLGRGFTTLDFYKTLQNGGL